MKVLNKIQEISSSRVYFDRTDGGTTCLKRIVDKQVWWKLLKDGIYVHRNVATAYGLTTEQ